MNKGHGLNVMGGAATLGRSEGMFERNNLSTERGDMDGV